MVQTALERAATFLDGEIVAPLRQRLMGRQLVSIKPTVKGAGIKAAEVLKIIEMGKASIEYKLPKDMSRDMVRIEKETVNIPVLYKGYEIDRESIDAYAREGIAIDTAAAVSAAQMVGVQEDAAIIQGWKPDGSTYKMKGLYQWAGVPDGTTYSFATYGDAKKAVAKLISLLELKHVYPPFNYVVNPEQWAELVISESTTGIRELPAVIDILNGSTPGGGRVLSSPDIVAGTALMCPVDGARVYMELLNPVTLRNVLGEDSKMPGISDITGTSYEALYLHVKQVDAIGKHTVI